MLTLDTIGKGLTFAVSDDDIAKLLSYESVKERIVRIGLSNILKDSHASVARDECESDEQWKANSMALVQRAYDAMMAGEVRSRVAGVRAPSDPIGKEAARLARITITPLSDDKEVMATWTASFGLPNTNADEAKAIVTEARRRYAEREETIAEATRNVESYKSGVAAAKKVAISL